MQIRKQVIKNIESYAKVIYGQKLQDVEKTLGLAENALTNVERLNLTLDIGIVVKVAEYLGVTLDDLVNPDSQIKILELEISRYEEKLEELRERKQAMEQTTADCCDPVEPKTIVELMDSMNLRVIGTYLHNSMVIKKTGILVRGVDELKRALAELNSISVKYKDGSSLLDKDFSYLGTDMYFVYLTSYNPFCRRVEVIPHLLGLSGLSYKDLRNEIVQLTAQMK